MNLKSQCESRTIHLNTLTPCHRRRKQTLLNTTGCLLGRCLRVIANGQDQAILLNGNIHSLKNIHAQQAAKEQVIAIAQFLYDGPNLRDAD
jgi:hypothetical protein